VPCLGLSLSPARFSGQAATKEPAARRALSRPNSGVSFGLDRRSPPGRYTFIPPGRAGVLPCREPPWGRTGALAPRAAHGSRAAAGGEHGTSAGWAGAKAATGAARRLRKPLAAGARAQRPTIRAAQRSAPQRGCLRGLVPLHDKCGLAAQREAGATRRSRVDRSADRCAARPWRGQSAAEPAPHRQAPWGGGWGRARRSGRLSALRRPTGGARSGAGAAVRKTRSG
jgi:hypothetical protein